MKMIIAIAAAAASLAVGVAPSSASSNAGPLRSAQAEANNLVANGISWSTGDETVDYAECTGVGARIGSRYRQFRCYVEVEEDAPYWIRVRTGWSIDLITFLYYD